MKIHHLNAGTMCPFGRRLMTGNGSYFEAAELVCHVLVVETSAGVVLVDTGLGLEDVRQGRKRLGGPFVGITRPRLDAEETVFHQLWKLGLAPEDVRHIVLTHCDLDHAGGLGDFPHARVHTLAAEAGAAREPATAFERLRYRRVQWSHAPAWSTYEPSAGEPWKGFECVRKLEGLPPEILMIPLLGHTRGHAGVAVETPVGWLLHCGDAYFHAHEMSLDRPRCPPGLAIFQKVVAFDDAMRRNTQERLRTLLRGEDDVRAFSAHDPSELARFAVPRR